MIAKHKCIDPANGWELLERQPESLTEQESQRLEEHVDTCEFCRKSIESDLQLLQSIYNLIHRTVLQEGTSLLCDLLIQRCSQESSKNLEPDDPLIGLVRKHVRECQRCRNLFQEWLALAPAIPPVLDLYRATDRIHTFNLQVSKSPSFFGVDRVGHYVLKRPDGQVEWEKDLSEEDLFLPEEQIDDLKIAASEGQEKELDTTSHEAIILNEQVLLVLRRGFKRARLIVHLLK